MKKITFIVGSLIWILLLINSSNVFSQAVTVSYPAVQTFNVGVPISPLIPTVTGGPATSGSWTVTSFAGSGVGGLSNGNAAEAKFLNPLNSATDANGNTFIADVGNRRIRKITPQGNVSTFVGQGNAGDLDGIGSGAMFRHPAFIAIDANGNLFISDQQNHKIKKITPSGEVTTFAGNGSIGSSDGTGTSASFQYPMGLVFDASGNLFVADAYNHKIRKITPSGVVSTFAGTGALGFTNSTALSSTFNYPMGLAFDPSGNLFVADRLNHAIRKIAPDGTVSTLAGSGTAGYMDGTGIAAQFNNANNLVTDNDGNVYLADQLNNMIRKITPTGVVSTLAGSLSSGGENGAGAVARFASPYGISKDGNGNMYVTENVANRVRKISRTEAFTINPQLPPGLTFNQTTGVISGTPLSTSPQISYQVTVNSETHSSVFSINITIKSGDNGPGTANQNYLLTFTPRKAGLTNAGAVIDASSDKDRVGTVLQYMDGLGRAIQTVKTKANSDGTRDLIQPFFYDQLGRESIKYLPYMDSGTSNGSYRENAITPGQGVFSFYNSETGLEGTQQSNGIVNTGFPFSKTVFEASAMNRPLEQGAPGASWQPIGNSSEGHTNKIQYGTNNLSTDFMNAGYAVRLFEASPVSIAGREHERVLSGNGYFTSNELHLTISKDENWKSGDGKSGTIEEYKDKSGKLLLKRTFNQTSAEVLSTYYVYDELGNLSFVIPPGANPDATSVPDQTLLDNFCYQYRYDERGRLIEKKIPGKGWEYMIYNKLNQLVFSQDAEQRKRNLWLVTRYDNMGRVIMTGTWNNGNAAISPSALITQVDASPLWDVKNNGLLHGYELKSYPTSLDTVLTVNYYDTYDIIGLPASYDRMISHSDKTHGMPTAQKTLVLNGGTDMLWTVNYYDDLGRNTRQINQHYKGGTLLEGNYDENINIYNFANEVLSTKRIHKVEGVDKLTTKTSYDYDHLGRLINTWQRINDGDSILLVKNEYNDLGQLKKKSLHSVVGGQQVSQDVILNGSDLLNSGQQRTVIASNSITLSDGFEAKSGSFFSAKITSGAFLQTIRYAYNSRGWITQINDPGIISATEAFGTRLFYDDHSDSQRKQYNGNISGVNWQSKVPASSGFSQQQQSYDYLYDKLDRLTLASYTTPGKTGYFDESLSYDLMGNLATLQRKSSGSVIDELVYGYANANKSNRLVSVTDNSGSNEGLVNGVTTYTHDDNGSLVSEDRKALQVQYNLLNLPKLIRKTTTNETITYIYDAAGRKLRKVNAGNSRDYVDGIEYDNAGNLDFFHTPEGRVVKSGSSYSYEYMLKDHLGNTRSVVKQDGSILQVPDYYAFGMELNHNVLTPSPDNRYKYNGKEMQTELGLGQLDYGARFYDPVIGRWNVVDPLAEKMRNWSPYTYAFNNPIKFIDVGGQFPWPVQIRSFISTSSTGGGLFYGDGRGPSFKGTSRVHSSFIVDPSARKVSQPFTQSDATIFNGIPSIAPGIPGLPLIAKRGDPSGINENISFSDNSASFDFSHSGKDPITPGLFTPELDVHAGLSFKEDLKNGVLTINGSFSGDSFPSTEAFITDQSGKGKLFLGAKKEKGGLSDLFGDNKKSLFKVDMKVNFDNDGNFTGVTQGKTNYTVEEWNKKVQEGFK